MESGMCLVTTSKKGDKEEPASTSSAVDKKPSSTKTDVTEESDFSVTKASDLGTPRLSPTKLMQTITEIGTPPTPAGGQSTEGSTSSDSILSGIDTIQKKLTDLSDTSGKSRDGIPVIEKNIAVVSAYPPPTFEMLQEMNIEQTRNPVISTNKKRPPTKIVMAADARTNVTTQRQSLLDKFAQKSQERSLQEAASSSRGPFRMLAGESKSESASLPPLPVGHDDTSKTARDIGEEEANRKMWDDLRESGVASEKQEKMKEKSERSEKSEKTDKTDKTEKSKKP